MYLLFRCTCTLYLYPNVPSLHSTHICTAPTHVNILYQNAYVYCQTPGSVSRGPNATSSVWILNDMKQISGRTVNPTNHTQQLKQQFK
jgi:hypothetical protein